MGTPKQLLQWGNTSLLGHAIAQAKKVNNHVFVVLGANYDVISPKITGVKTIYNKDWELGMGSSIAVGVNHIGKDGAYSHILIMLADQPYLDAVYLKKMMDVAAKKPNGIVATQYQDKVGVPAVFNAAFFNELEQLDQDYGARKLMKRHQDVIVALSPKTSTLDIDTQETYQKQRTNNS